MPMKYVQKNETAYSLNKISSGISHIIVSYELAGMDSAPLKGNT